MVILPANIRNTANYIKERSEEAITLLQISEWLINSLGWLARLGSKLWTSDFPDGILAKFLVGFVNFALVFVFQESLVQNAHLWPLRIEFAGSKYSKYDVNFAWTP